MEEEPALFLVHEVFFAPAKVRLMLMAFFLLLRGDAAICRRLPWRKGGFLLLAPVLYAIDRLLKRRADGMLGVLHATRLARL
jgi:hypothetical protein